MEAIIGNQRFTANGNLTPSTTNLGFRVYSVHGVSTLSTSNLSLYNGLSSSDDLYIRCNSDSQGVIDYEWAEGKYFPNNVYLETNAAITFALVGYNKATA